MLGTVFTSNLLWYSSFIQHDEENKGRIALKPHQRFYVVVMLVRRVVAQQIYKCYQMLLMQTFWQCFCVVIQNNERQIHLLKLSVYSQSCATCIPSTVAIKSHLTFRKAKSYSNVCQISQTRHVKAAYIIVSEHIIRLHSLFTGGHSARTIHSLSMQMWCLCACGWTHYDRNGFKLSPTVLLLTVLVHEARLETACVTCATAV